MPFDRGHCQIPYPSPGPKGFTIKIIIYTSFFFSCRENLNLNCKSKNLIYLIECKKCTKQYIGETKRQLHERFGEHRRSIQNHHQLTKPTPVSAHFNQPGHSINHLLLTPLELIHSKRDSVRKAREAHLINKATTLEPLGINRRDEQN